MLNTTRYHKFFFNISGLLLGCALPLAFAPLRWFWLAPIVLCGLLAIWLRSSAKQAAWRGLLFGIGFFGVGVSWVYISIHRFGGTDIPLSLIITAGFVFLLALFHSLQGYLFARFFSKYQVTKALLIFPLSWVFIEWVRSRLFTGFPWLLLGCSQVDSWLKGYAPVLGVYGVSFIVALSAALLYVVIFHRRKRRYIAFISLLALWLIGFGLSTIHWTKPIGRPIQVSLIQGNIPQTLKWLPEQVEPTLNRYQKLTEKNWSSDIIVWPEAAVPLPLPYSKKYLDDLSQLARKHQTALIVGVPIQANEKAFYNGVVVLGEGKGVYNKRQLVPFGEYVPLEKLLRGLIAFFNLPMSNFISGTREQPLLSAKNIPLATFICYEIAYTNLLRRDLPEAQVLITMSNDAWFGESWAASQHLQIAQMASLIAGRYQLFVSNNGITAIIKPNGEILKRLPRFKTDVLTDCIYAMG